MIFKKEADSYTKEKAGRELLARLNKEVMHFMIVQISYLALERYRQL